MTRTDIHRPAEFDPADYRVIDYVDNRRPSLDGWVAITPQVAAAYERAVAAWEQRIFAHFPDWQTGGGDHTSIFQCNHCGHPGIRYVAVVEHVPTGARLAFGEICADRCELSGRDAFKKKYARDAAAIAQKQFERELARAKFDAENPEAVEFLMSLNTDYDSREPDFLLDVRRKLVKDGTLSPAQVAAVLKFKVKRDEQQAKRDAEPKPEGPVVEGRRQVTGEIISTKWQESDFGGSLKMLVREADGNKVWGTVPNSLQDLTRGPYLGWHDENGTWVDNPDRREPIELKGQDCDVRGSRHSQRSGRALRLLQASDRGSARRADGARMSAIEALRESIAQIAEAERQIHEGSTRTYAGIYDFVLREGRVYEPCELTDLTYGKPRACFYNAALTAALYKRTAYIEGFAFSPTVSIPVHHAWNLTADGRLADITWNPVGIAYFGVEIPVEVIGKLGPGKSVIDDWPNNWPLLQKPWVPV
jgi:hypothetical protein